MCVFLFIREIHLLRFWSGVTMGAIRYRFVDIEKVDYLRNPNYYHVTSPIDDVETKTAADDVFAMAAAASSMEKLENSIAVVNKMYNSSNQLLIEPGVIDTFGNTLLHLASNSSGYLSTSAAASSSTIVENPLAAAALMDNVNISVDENYIESDGDFRHSMQLTIVFCIAYVVVFVVGFLGNLLTVMAVWKLPRMRTVTNYFIVSLAIADMLVLMLCLPGTLMSNIFVRK